MGGTFAASTAAGLILGVCLGLGALDWFYRPPPITHPPTPNSTITSRGVES